MSKFTIDMTSLIDNKVFLAVVCGIIGVIMCYLDSCLFVNKRTNITYVKVFIMVSIIVFGVLTVYDKLNVDNHTLDHSELETGCAPF
tara:strand:+ start:338 stop:598 length:261 start_codon:yes stop_codon:yes gene_type:complete